jgi:hypothetical protein
MDLRAITDLEGGRLQSGKLFGPVGPAISHRFQVWRANIDIANRLWVHFSLARPVATGIIGPFTSASLNPPSTHNNVMLTNTFYRQMPAVKTNHGTPACPLPGAKSPLTPLLHRRHHRLHRLTAATTQ